MIHAYLDGELDLLSTLQLEAHLRECAACAQAYKNHQTLRSAMSSGGLYFKPPNDLAQRVRLALHEADKAGGRASAPVRELPQRISWPQLPKRIGWRSSWAVAGIAAAAMVALAVLRLGPVGSKPPSEWPPSPGGLARPLPSPLAQQFNDGSSFRQP